MANASGKRKVVGIRRKRLPNGRYLQLYVLEGRGPRGGRTVGYVLSRKGSPAGSSSAPAPGAAASAPSSGRPAVIVKRKRHGGSGYRDRGR